MVSGKNLKYRKSNSVYRPFSRAVDDLDFRQFDETKRQAMHEMLEGSSRRDLRKGDSGDMGGRRYFVRELSNGWDIYDNKKNRSIRKYDDQDEAMNQCYYLNWEYDRKSHSEGIGSRVKNILFGLSAMSLAAAVPVVVKTGMEWWLRNRDEKSFEKLSPMQQARLGLDDDPLITGRRRY